MRSLFKKDTARSEPVDLNEVVRETVPLLRSEASRRSVSLRVELAPDLPRVTGDRVQLQQVFDAFFTTKPHGTGMGLTISRSIVEAHGGRLWATARDGRGSTFHVALPAAEPARRP